VTVKSKPRSLQLVKLNLQENPPPVPDYLERTGTEPPEGRVNRLPTRGDVDPRIADINEQRIIEVSAR
jgi:small subunit ribosomal protein S4